MALALRETAEGASSQLLVWVLLLLLLVWVMLLLLLVWVMLLLLLEGVLLLLLLLIWVLLLLSIQGSACGRPCASSCEGWGQAGAGGQPRVHHRAMGLRWNRPQLGPVCGGGRGPDASKGVHRRSVSWRTAGTPPCLLGRWGGGCQRHTDGQPLELRKALVGAGSDGVVWGGVRHDRAKLMGWPWVHHRGGGWGRDGGCVTQGGGWCSGRVRRSA